jgi:hypothetical protein
MSLAFSTSRMARFASRSVSNVPSHLYCFFHPDAPNTTQIASGAGGNSAAGNNAAIDSSNTLQQQSVGAKGRARNLGMKGHQSEPHDKHGKLTDNEEITIVINNQINRTGKNTSSATQVASGGGTDSTGGTNAAIQSSNTKQQHAVGGDKSGRALNKGMNNKQKETRLQGVQPRVEVVCDNIDYLS